MAFTRVKPAGWAVNEILTSAQMNALDINTAFAVDGNAGGTYAPSTLIDMNGHDLFPAAQTDYTVLRRSFDVTLSAGVSSGLLFSIALGANDQEILIRSFIVAREATGTDRAAYGLAGGFKVTGGTLNNVGADDKFHEFEDDAGWNVLNTFSGNTLEVRGDADAANNTTFVGTVVLYRRLA
ncbi:MAG: hypothetical protein V3W41_22095 [Planctomycetota bacterium]